LTKNIFVFAKTKTKFVLATTKILRLFRGFIGLLPSQDPIQKKLILHWNFYFISTLNGIEIFTTKEIFIKYVQSVNEFKTKSHLNIKKYFNYWSEFWDPSR
jgi:hypothetical protein